MKERRKKKAPGQPRGREKKYYRNLAVAQLAGGAVLVAAAFLTSFGAFMLFGGGLLILAATNYLLYKGKPKSEDLAAEPDDSLNKR